MINKQKNFECNECGWSGDESSVSFETTDEVYICPNCGSDNLYIENIKKKERKKK